jgi:glucosamine--fructose-6-phosphate aminotransferase (isomerizing)
VDGRDIPFVEARLTQADRLAVAIESVTAQLTALQATGELTGPGPIFVGIGASLAAACAPVWELRGRGVHSWRLGAGDLPLPFPPSRHPIVGISQSGRSFETLTVLTEVPEQRRYAVVNYQPSPIAELVQRTISLDNIPDSYASTIGYTATIAALGLIADSWDGGTIDPGWARLPEIFRACDTEFTDQITPIAALFTSVESIDFVGAGPSVGSAESGALLFREVARVHATAMSTRQYLHGSMESAGGGVHVLLGDTRELEVARTLSEAGHQVVLLTAEPVPPGPRLCTVRMPALPPARRAVIEALFMQVLVGEVANLRGVEIEEFVFNNTDTKVAMADPTP